jgi:hypothetical protein
MLPSVTTLVTTTQELKGTKICRFQHEATKTRVFLKLNCKKRKTCNVCKQWSCNGRHEHLEILSDYRGNSLDKGILEKFKKKRKVLAFYTAANKLKP